MFDNAEGHTQYAVVGFTTVYEFYAYPANIRPRVSQMLVLPPFQRLGIATALMETIYKKYVSDPKVSTVTGKEGSFSHNFSNITALFVTYCYWMFREIFRDSFGINLLFWQYFDQINS